MYKEQEKLHWMQIGTHRTCQIFLWQEELRLRWQLFQKTNFFFCFFICWPYDQGLKYGIPGIQGGVLKFSKGVKIASIWVDAFACMIWIDKVDFIDMAVCVCPNLKDDIIHSDHSNHATWESP